MKVSLILKPDTTLVKRKAKPVPYGTRVKVEEELDKFLSLGLIKPIVYSEWAAPIMVILKPNGNSRLCVDYSTVLNK